MDSEEWNISKIWTKVDRENFRKQVNLPILQSKEVFVKRLKNEKTLVVIAETGSGKTTQLPQYMAEEFESEGGLIVVTQPRALAAASIAERVGYEFDGPEVNGSGYSVGFKAGKSLSQQNTNRILFMTDAQFIRELIKDELVRHVRALLIDEAHERSINTDIVLGIAKTLLEKRRDNFYVVVASATIDPKLFLEYFGQKNRKPLEVPGRVFPVEIFYEPINNALNNGEKVSIGISNEDVVGKTIEVVKRFKHGHALVFLTGQREVENCVEKFKAQAPQNFEALPLFGSLDMDAQKEVMEFDCRKQPGKDRLVVFSTNVAETSLTVPGVKIVIDTGLSKEAKYDAKRRSKVLELTWISKASADQRKGRAGRLSEGVCVRLYSQETLIRTSIEPEIVRSSIDLIILQLKVLKLDKIELITKPDDDKLKLALKNLQICEAIDENLNVTNLGVLYSNLPFDPIISAFVIDLFFNHNRNIGMLIASLMTAPGDVFYLGDRTTRDEDEKKIALLASNFDSDIKFKIDVFQKWSQAGLVEDVFTAKTRCYKCKNCHQLLNYKKTCGHCQTKYAVENKLNNRVLKYIQSTILEVQFNLENFKNSSKFEKLKQSINHHKDNECLDSCLSKALSDWFFDQAGHTLVPGIPVIGMRVISSNEVGSINSKSCMINESNKSNEIIYFISLSPFFRISKPGQPDFITANNLHPIKLRHLKHCRNSSWVNENSLDISIVKVFSQDNVGPQVANMKEEKSGIELKKRNWFSGLIYPYSPFVSFCNSIYDKNNCSIDLYAPLCLKEKLSNIASNVFGKILENLNNKVYEKPFYIFKESTIAKIKNGFLCASVQPLKNETIIVLRNLEFEDYPSFTTKFFEKYTIHRSDLLDFKYNSRSKDALLIFKDKGSAVKYRKLFPQSIQENIDSSRSISLNTYKLDFEALIEPDLSVENLSKVFEIKVIRVTDTTRDETFSLCIGKLKGNFQLPDWLPKPENHYLKNNDSKVSVGSSTLYLNYKNQYTANQAKSLCMRYLDSYSATIPGGKTVTITPIVNEIQKRVKLTWKAEFENELDAQSVFEKKKILSNLHKIQVKSFFSKYINLNSYLESEIDQLKSEIEKHGNGIECELKKINNAVRFIVKNASPLILNKIKKNVFSKFDPISLNLPPKTDPVRRYYFELLLNDSIFLEETANSLGVFLQKSNSSFQIYGEKINLGMFMRALADNFDQFQAQYAAINLDVKTSLLFEKNRVGAAHLENLVKVYGKIIKISYNSFSKQIELYAPNRFETNFLNDCAAKINEILSKMSEKNDKIDANEMCVFCGNNDSLITLLNCGHKTCKDCLKILSESFTQLPIACDRCKTPLEVNDIFKIISPYEKDELVEKVIFHYAKYSSHFVKNNLRFCPLNCGSLIDATSGYSRCPKCLKSACSICDSTNSLHEGLNCEEFKKYLNSMDFEYQIKRLVPLAKDWVTQNWSHKLGPIHETLVNPNIEVSETSIRKQFDRAVKSLSITDLAKNGFFAWHGTAETSINPIISGGFDPNRRSGQVYGPGEYFGTTAEVSSGYCKNDNHMLVVFILNGSHVKHAENFCYVVQNPLDRSLTYCLPLLILNFKIRKSITVSVITSSIKQPEELLHNYVCYHWEMDDGEFEPYSHFNTEKIEREYMRYLSSNRTLSSNAIIDIIKYVNDKPQKYSIDFEKWIQINCTTKYTRRIERRAIKLNANKNSWEYEDNSWTRFDILWQDKIESHFQHYLNGSKPHTLTIRCAPRPEPYEINFMCMTEKNLIFGTTRKIRRN